MSSVTSSRESASAELALRERLTLAQVVISVLERTGPLLLRPLELGKHLEILIGEASRVDDPGAIPSTAVGVAALLGGREV